MKVFYIAAYTKLSILFVGECHAQYGTIQKEGVNYTFNLGVRNSEQIILKRWSLMHLKFQEPIANRPEDHILTGEVGDFNIGMAAPQSGLFIFFAKKNKRPVLLGMTDANGKFAVKIPKGGLENSYLYLGGALQTGRQSQKENGKNCMAVGSLTYQVKIPKKSKE